MAGPCSSAALPSTMNGHGAKVPVRSVGARLRSDAGAARQIRSVEDVLQVGQEVDVVCTGRDAKGHLMVSRKALLSPPSGGAAARAASSA